MSGQPDLSVVVPVYNVVDHLGPLVDELDGVDAISIEIILVDDASTDGSAELVDRLGEKYDSVQTIRHETNRGAGAARNSGFAQVSGRYTLFFDADDIPHCDALVEAIPLLDESGADLAMLPYRYRRGSAAPHEAMNDFDVEVWREYVGRRSKRDGSLDAFPRLLGFSNYPWNKILRSATYQASGLRFGETAVHNDILGHWHSLLLSTSILLINRDICTHVVETSGANLTNQHDRRRLALFDALDETYDLLRAHPHLRNRYSHHYWSMVVRTAAWAADRIAADLIDEFNTRLQEHLLRMSLADFLRIRTKRDGALADLLVRRATA